MASVAGSTAPPRRARYDAQKINHGLNELRELRKPQPKQRKMELMKDSETKTSSTEQFDAANLVDIVAVGGLGAAPGITWTYRKDQTDNNPVNWLSDENMLPKRFAQARIMEYQYASKYYGVGAVNQTVLPIARELLVQLKICRKECPKRPIIFIAHCLGGIVVEKAICHAKERLDEWETVFTAITGVIFLATPFNGTKLQGRADLLAGSMAIVGQGVKTDLLNILKWENSELGELRDKFKEIVRKDDLMIHCFYELYESELVRFMPSTIRQVFSSKEKIVEISSAILDSPNDATAIEADHFGINKFYGPKDGRFLRVQEQLGDMVNKSHKIIKGRVQDLKRVLVSAGELESIRRELFISDSQSIRLSIEKANPAIFPTGELQVAENKDTLKISSEPCFSTAFIFREKVYLEWMAAKSSATLWIRGRSGIGKTLFAVEALRRLEEDLKRMEKNTLLAYHFCDGMSESTSQPFNVLKSVLWQMIAQSQRYDLAKHVLASKLAKKSSGTSGYVTASVPALLSYLQNMLYDANVSAVYIVIDGLDKMMAGSQRREFLNGIKELIERGCGQNNDISIGGEWEIQPAELHFLFLGQSHSDVEACLQTALQIDLDGSAYQELVKHGQSLEFSQRLAELAKRQKYGPSLEYLVKTYIKTKAVSESVWVTLACGELEARDVAAAKGQTVIVDKLLPLTMKKLWIDAFHQAVRHGSLNSAKTFLENGVSVIDKGEIYQSAMNALDAPWTAKDQNQDDDNGEGRATDDEDFELDSNFDFDDDFDGDFDADFYKYLKGFDSDSSDNDEDGDGTHEEDDLPYSDTSGVEERFKPDSVKVVYVDMKLLIMEALDISGQIERRASSIYMVEDMATRRSISEFLPLPEAGFNDVSPTILVWPKPDSDLFDYEDGLYTFEHDNLDYYAYTVGNIPFAAHCPYFEVTIVEFGESTRCAIGVGLSTVSAEKKEMVGWWPGSWGYHSDDGEIYINSTGSHPYGDSYSSGDTVGCGLGPEVYDQDPRNRAIFFTKNGRHLGNLMVNIHEMIMPAVTIRGDLVRFTVNFGQEDFMWRRKRQD